MGSYCSTPAAKELSSKEIASKRPERARSDSTDDTSASDESAGSAEITKPALVPSESGSSTEDLDALKDSSKDADAIPGVPAADVVAEVKSSEEPAEAPAEESEESIDIEDEDLEADAAAFEKFFSASLEDGASSMPSHLAAQQSYNQLFSMLATPTLDAGSLEEATDRRRKTISATPVAYPPLGDATFAIEIIKIHFVRAKADSAPSEMPAAKPKLTFSESVFSDDEVEILAADAVGDKVKRRKGVSIKAYYEHSGAQIVRKTDDFDGRKGSDTDTIEVRELLEFDLGVTTDEIPRDMTMIDEDAEPEPDSIDDEHVEGQIDLMVREKKKHIAKAEIKLSELLEMGMISRRGEWTDLNLVMYKVRDKRKTILKRAISLSTKESEPKKRKQVGYITARCHLLWSPEALRAFGESQKSVSVDRPLDKMTLMASRLAKLKLTILGAVFDSDEKMDFLQSLDSTQMSKLLLRSEVSGEDEEKHKDIVIVGEYKCGDSDVVEKHTSKHSSRDDKMLFFGEELDFDVLPFPFHGVEFPSGDHPQIEYRDEKVCAAPGAVLLKLLGKGDVWAKPKEMGCCLLNVNNLFADVTLATGKTASDEFLFIKPLYETLYEVRWTREISTPQKFQCGALFLKASFEW